MLKLKKALLVIDVQNDFCRGGALEVPRGDEVIPVLNKYIKAFSAKKLPLFASRDWHPKKTRHFKPFGGAWPAHCVQHTRGAAFHPKLKLPAQAIVLSKGMGPDEEDGYSDFQAVDLSGMGFLYLLKMFGVSELYVGGLATDYCVKYTVIDALKNGFRVFLLLDAIRGVNIKPTDSDEAIREMVAWGAHKITFEKLVV